MDLSLLAQSARAASRKLALLTTEQKNSALAAIADGLRQSAGEISAANAKDLEEGRKQGLADSFLDRLLLDEKRIADICRDIENVIGLEDSIGQVVDERVRPNGLRIQRVRVPLGVVLMIYEARPNVTVDSAILCLKSGCAAILRGGKEAFETNRALVRVIHRALSGTSIPPDAVQFVDTTDRTAVTELLRMKGLIDVVIPRGGQGLIEHVCNTSKIPVIETGSSPVHVYVDKYANLEKAVAIAVNAKTRRISICNTLDVLLVHEALSEKFLRRFAHALQEVSSESGAPLVELRCDDQARCILESEKCAEEACKKAQHPYPKLTRLNPAKDYDTEYLDFILAVHVVSGLTEALEHIAAHSRGHSESIVTEDHERAERFLREVDSACVYFNASTQFSDGAEFGLGAEIGISTQKLHVRGPFALEGLTTVKWKIYGDGQVRTP